MKWCRKCNALFNTLAGEAANHGENCPRCGGPLIMVSLMSATLDKVEELFNAWWKTSGEGYLTAASFGASMKAVLDGLKPGVPAAALAGGVIFDEIAHMLTPEQLASLPAPHPDCSLGRPPDWPHDICNDYTLADGVTPETPRATECDGCRYNTKGSSAAEKEPSICCTCSQQGRCVMEGSFERVYACVLYAKRSDPAEAK
jgi:hypothetical protein